MLKDYVELKEGDWIMQNGANSAVRVLTTSRSDSGWEQTGGPSRHSDCCCTRAKDVELRARPVCFTTCPSYMSDSIFPSQEWHLEAERALAEYWSDSSAHLRRSRRPQTSWQNKNLARWKGEFDQVGLWNVLHKPCRRFAWLLIASVNMREF